MDKIVEKGFIRSIGPIDGQQGVVALLLEVVVPVKPDADGKVRDILIHSGEVVLTQGDTV